MNILNIGFGNIVFIDKVNAIISSESAPVKRIISEARDRGMLIDATYGRRTRSVIIMQNNHVILSVLLPQTASARILGKAVAAPSPEEEEEEESL